MDGGLTNRNKITPSNLTQGCPLAIGGGFAQDAISDTCSDNIH